MNETANLLRIWAVFMRRPNEELYGLEVGRSADVGPGVLYPRLKQLVGAGVLAQCEYEADGRIYYRLTAEGYRAGVEALAPFQVIAPRVESDELLTVD